MDRAIARSPSSEPVACRLLHGSVINNGNKPSKKGPIPMLKAVTFETINTDALDDITGGFEWGQLARATGGGAVTGAAGGAVGGAITGSFAGGVGALPGAGIGALAGGAGGAVTGAINNVGQQFGWWK
jgi:hypothetical protein